MLPCLVPLATLLSQPGMPSLYPIFCVLKIPSPTLVGLHVIYSERSLLTVLLNVDLALHIHSFTASSSLNHTVFQNV